MAMTSSRRLFTKLNPAGDDYDEFGLTTPLCPLVTWEDIAKQLPEVRRSRRQCSSREKRQSHPLRHKMLWLDDDCFLAVGDDWEDHIVPGYMETVNIEVPCHFEEGGMQMYYIFQSQRSFDAGSLALPGLDFLIDRLSVAVSRLVIKGVPVVNFVGNMINVNPLWRLDVSIASFSNLLRRSHQMALELGGGDDKSDGRPALLLRDFQLNAEQTKLLFAYDDTGPINVCFKGCYLHQPTMQQLTNNVTNSQNLMRPASSSMQTDARMMEGRIRLDFEEHDHGRYGAEVGWWLWNRRLGGRFVARVFYESRFGQLIRALAANKNPNIEELELVIGPPAMQSSTCWIGLWKVIAQHPSLKRIKVVACDFAMHEQWWQTVADAIQRNPRLVDLVFEQRGCARYVQSMERTRADVDVHIEPLVQRNIYRPRIASLCASQHAASTAPSPAGLSTMLGQAIVANVTSFGTRGRLSANSKENNECAQLEVRRMLVEELVLSGHDFGGSTGLLGKRKR